MNVCAFTLARCTDARAIDMRHAFAFDFRSMTRASGYGVAWAKGA
jgi:hypothetical protein